MQFGILIFPQVEELDFVGPWELAGLWHELAAGPECFIVAEHAGPVTCAHGLSVNPHRTFADSPELDYLLVPGGQGTRSQVNNPALVEFIAHQGARCRAVLSVCTGAFLLHAAGLLQGRRATTHWGSLQRLRALGDVNVVEARMCQDGNIWCAAGISAGMDLMLRFIASVAGEASAGQVQYAAEYYPAGECYGDLHLSHPQSPAYLKARG